MGFTLGLKVCPVLEQTQCASRLGSPARWRLCEARATVALLVLPPLPTEQVCGGPSGSHDPSALPVCSRQRARTWGCRGRRSPHSQEAPRNAPSFLGLCTQNDNARRNSDCRVPATVSQRHRPASDDHGGPETGSRPAHLADEEVEAQSGWESCPRPV